MLFENEAYKELASFICRHKAEFRVEPGVIEIYTSATPSELETLGKGLIKYACYGDVCYSNGKKIKQPVSYDHVVLRGEIDPYVFDDYKATYMCGVPVSREYWTGKRVDVDTFMTEPELVRYLKSLNLKPYCYNLSANVYYCPDYFQNRLGLVDCTGVTIIRGEPAYINGDVYGTVYITRYPELFCKPGTLEKAYTPPPPDLFEFMKMVVYVYADPPDADISHVPIRTTDAEEFLKYLVKENVIKAYCNTVKGLEFDPSYIAKLNKLSRCQPWNS